MTRGKLARVVPLLQRPRYEVFPAASTEEAVLEWVPTGLPVTVTASPAKGLGPTLDLTETLAGTHSSTASSADAAGNTS